MGGLGIYNVPMPRVQRIHFSSLASQCLAACSHHHTPSVPSFLNRKLYVSSRSGALIADTHTYTHLGTAGSLLHWHGHAAPPEPARCSLLWWSTP
eukprot:scaffold156466_cov23-Tisochrysis_lutea.AAC.2